MRPKVPRQIKVEVIRLWIQGRKREEIARKIDIGAGTVSAIINEARKQAEYHDIDLLRQTSLILREEGLELFLLSFAIRLNNLMKDNDIDENQLEIIISEFAAYCFKNDSSYERLIEAGLKALELENEFGIKVKLLSEYVTQGKTMMERLEREKQGILNRIMGAQKELDVIDAEMERYGGEKALIEQNRKLEKELKEARQSEELYKQRVEGSERRWQNESALASKLQDDKEDLNQKLVDCQRELDRIREETGWHNRQLG